MRIKNKEMLTSHGNIEGRKIVAELLDAGLDALDPYFRGKDLVKLEGGRIILDNRGCEMKGDPHSGPAVFDLKDYDRVYVVGAAKGVQRAALAMEEVLGDVLTGGHVIGKHGEEILCKKIGVTLAGHPVPDACCVEGCEKIVELARDITRRDLVFTITGSGCGSLMTCPAGDISIRDIADFTYMMQIEKGVPTGDLNQVRTHIDRLKGGRLSRLFSPASLVHLTTADPSKMGTPVLRMSYFDMLRSNTFFPSIAAASTYADAINVIKRWDAWEKTPESIMKHLMNGGSHNENMTVEEYEKLNARFFGLIFKDGTVYPAVKRKAKELGYDCLMLSEYMQAEAREAGHVNSLMALCAERLGEPFKPPMVLMTSGENVVTVGGETGIGGRNQEYCTAAAINLKGSKRVVFGAVDTDGTDGPGGLRLSGAPDCLAGAIVDGYTFEEARKAGINLWDTLKTHGTSEPLWKLSCGVEAEYGVSALDLGLILIM
jgi:glycerate 2-kinase